MPDAAAGGAAAAVRADLEAGALRRQRRRGRRRGPRGGRRARRGTAGAAAVAISARVESELGELDATTRPPRCAAELGISESGLDAADPRRLRAARPDRLLHRRRGQGGDGPQPRAAARPPGRRPGRIHGEIQQAFVRAEVVGWEDLVEAGGYAPARDRGLLRTEGRTYVVADGDVITIKV